MSSHGTSVATADRMEVLAAAFRAHQPWLVRRLALVVGDAEEARDLAQITFLRAAEHWTSEHDIAPWLAVVGVRLAISERRRRRRWGFLPLDDGAGSWAIDVDPDLWRAIGQLDRRTRAALVLTVLDGYTQEEVGKTLDLPRGTVASLLSRGREHLRRALEVGP